MSGRSLPNSLSQLTMRLKKSVEMDLNCMEKLTNDCGLVKAAYGELLLLLNCRIQPIIFFKVINLSEEFLVFGIAE